MSSHSEPSSAAKSELAPEQGVLTDLLGIQYLSLSQLEVLLSTSENFCEVSERALKKVPALRGKTIINCFMEPSTRTRSSFEIAGKRLSADTINVGGSSSSVVKGETLLDTIHTLQCMRPDAIVLRHKAGGAPVFLRKHLSADTAIINAGDGVNEHPTQLLLDLLTLKQYFQRQERSLRGLKLAIVGDIRHSRVARSALWAHALLGNEVRLVGPRTLVPDELCAKNGFPGNVHICHRLEEGLEGVDVVNVLRMQLERQSGHFVPSLEEYTRGYCVTEAKLSRYCPDSVVLHPGPANRGIEISTEVHDGPRSLVSNQVTNGVAVRMAVLFLLCTGRREVNEVAE